MQAESLKQVINNLRIWQRGDQRAPHKPLLFLYALGRVSRGELRKMQYKLVKGDLKNYLHYSARIEPLRYQHLV